MKKLNERQCNFVDEYIIDLNATQAAIRAGYSKRTARSQGQRLLTNVDIKNAIEKRMKEKTDELIMKQDEILVRLSEQARREAIDHQVVLVEKPSFDDNGNFLGVEKKPEVVQVPTQNKDAIRALELLGRRYSMWTDNQNVNIQGSVQFIDDISDANED
jgi:phage terminase small subunit